MAEIDVWQAIHQELADGHDCRLLYVADHRGSSPGKKGAQMMLGRSGSRAGTLGGGAVEAAFVRTAQDTFNQPAFTATRAVLQHRTDVAQPSGMICGGEQTLVCVRLAKAHLPAVEQLLATLARGHQQSWSVTPGGWQLQDDTTLYTPDVTGTRTAGTDPEYWHYIHRAGPSHSVYLIGGGHVALALSRLLAPLDFRVVVIDERRDVDTVQQNRFAHTTLCQPYETLANLVPPGRENLVAIMTHAADRDAAALAALRHLPLGYLGLLGSARKIREITAQALTASVTPATALTAPMGLPIGSRTPEEIAVSIAAELIQLRHQHHSATAD